MHVLLVYLAVGLFVGVFAGLLGVGGGTIIVPILDIMLPLENIDSSIVHHMALATSMGSIAFTSLSSARSHNKRGTVIWDVVKGMAPGIIAGTLSGTFVVTSIPTRPLKIIFVVFLTYTAIQMILDFKPKASFHLPNKLWLLFVGLFIGVISSFVGIGGGALIVPFLVMCNIPMINAIGISACLGFPLAVAGSVGFIYNGLNLPNLPPYALGYIYLPALAGLVAASMLTAPLGVKLSHSLPVKALKRCFGVMLLVMAARMAYSIM